MTVFTTEETKILRELVQRLKFSFLDPLFVEGHPFYKEPKKRRRFLKKLGVKL